MNGVHKPYGEICRAFRMFGGQMAEYKSFLKTVGGNEGNKCKYPTRLDSYGCGCSHNCDYCYARHLLEFRNLWHPELPSVADIAKIEKALDKIPKGTILRLGGMTDCFQPIEKKYRVTYQLIQKLDCIPIQNRAYVVFCVIQACQLSPSFPKAKVKGQHEGDNIQPW